MPAPALQRFQAHAAAARQRLLGGSCRVNSILTKGTYSAQRQSREYNDAGSETVVHRSTLRLIKSEFPAYANTPDWKGITIDLPTGDNTWRTYRILTVTDSHLSGEWVLTLESP